MGTTPPGTAARDRDAVRSPAERAEDDTPCPYRFVRGLLTALALVTLLWSSLAAVVFLTAV